MARARDLPSPAGKKPCGLIIDFVGVLKELNKALAFASADVSGVIEDLELLQRRFQELMDGEGRRYLADAGRVINLAVAMAETTTRDGREDPMLVGIAERAQKVLEDFTERQTSTQQALDLLARLTEERQALDEECAASGLDDRTFSIYWILQREKLGEPETLAREIADGFRRFANFAVNADELRQVKAEIYRALLRQVQGQRMLVLAGEILRVVRQ